MMVVYPHRAEKPRRRKEAYEALPPETRHEAFKGNQHTGSRQLGDNQPERFTANTERKTGQSERAVQWTMPTRASFRYTGGCGGKGIQLIAIPPGPPARFCAQLNQCSARRTPDRRAFGDAPIRSVEPTIGPWARPQPALSV
jgi:hypothetical protein